MSVFELTLIALVIMAGSSIIWTTLAVGISPMPSSQKARLAMMQLIETAEIEADIEASVVESFEASGAIVDLGSGWGSLTIRMAVKYPDRQIIGYELSYFPWFVSVLVAKCLGLNNLSVYRQDYLKADFSATSIVVCYLFPAGMVALETKLAEQKTSIRYVISNNFALPSFQPEKTIQLYDFYRSQVYRYRIG
ncbi:MAG: hypothetical protein ACJASY_004301 [Halioglobus sp.]